MDGKRSKSPLQVRVMGAAVLLLLLGCEAAWGQSSRSQPAPQSSPGDLTQVSIENLMNMEVTSVSKKGQKLSQVAAAIFVITKEDIRRSGATNIPDLLRMVPGMDVAQINGSTLAVGSRGFTGQYANKLLVMVDGRSVYSLTFSGVFWDTMDLPLFDIERIEVIRGPGGTIWGENAVTGVISIYERDFARSRSRKSPAGIRDGAVRGNNRQEDRLPRVYEVFQPSADAGPQWPKRSGRMAQTAGRISDG